MSAASVDDTEETRGPVRADAPDEELVRPEGGTGDDLTGPAPNVLSRPADPAPLPAPVRDTEEIASLHVNWARLTAGGDEHDTVAPPTGVRAKVRARVAAAAAVGASQDRALIGDLIRAVDTLAQRLDDVTERVHRAELLVQDVVDRLSEDLVRVQVAIEAAGRGGARPGSRGDDVPFADDVAGDR